VHRAVGEAGAGQRRAEGQLGDLEAFVELLWHGGDEDNPGEAELTVEVGAPAIRRVVGEQRAGVRIADPEVGDRGRERDVAGAGGLLVVTDLFVVVEAEAAPKVAAPAAQRAGAGEHDACGVVVGEQGGRLAADRHGPDRDRRLGLADLVDPRVSEVAPEVGAPAAHAALVAERAGVKLTRGQLHGVLVVRPDLHGR